MTQHQHDNPCLAVDLTAPTKVQKIQMRSKWEDIGPILIDDSSDEEDNNQIQQDQLDQAEIIEPILEEEEMEEELLETIPEQVPVNEGAKQKYPLDQSEAIDEVEHILEEENKEIVEEALDTNLEQVSNNEHGAKQQDKTENSFEETIAELEAVIENKNEIMLEYNNDILPEHDPNNDKGAKEVVDKSDTNEPLDKIDIDKNQEAVELLKDVQLEQVPQNEPDPEDLDDEVLLETIPVNEDKIQEISEPGNFLKEPVDDSDAKDDCFNESVDEIVSENDDKNPMVLDHVQPKPDHSCNDQGIANKVDDINDNEDTFNGSIDEIATNTDDRNLKMVLDVQPEHKDPSNEGFTKKFDDKNDKHDIFNASVDEILPDIIEVDKSDNNIPKQASGDKSDVEQNDDKHDETIEKILPILEENKIQMHEPDAHWDESAKQKLDKTGAKQDNDKDDNSDKTVEKILPILEENEILMQEPDAHWDESAKQKLDKTGSKQDNDKNDNSGENVEKILPILEDDELQILESDEKDDKIENSLNENDENLEFTFDEIEAVLDQTKVNEVKIFSNFSCMFLNPKVRTILETKYNIFF